MSFECCGTSAAPQRGVSIQNASSNSSKNTTNSGTHTNRQPLRLHKRSQGSKFILVIRMPGLLHFIWIAKYKVCETFTWMDFASETSGVQPLSNRISTPVLACSRHADTTHADHR